jgi:hypothetical protein
MATTLTSGGTVEADVRAFAAQYPTANTRRMVQLAEAGVITWADAYGVASKALAAGLAAVGGAR